jgi:hypothetical protein
MTAPTGLNDPLGLGQSIFYLGAAVGHVKDITTKKNYASGNAGGVLVATC